MRKLRHQYKRNKRQREEILEKTGPKLCESGCRNRHMQRERKSMTDIASKKSEDCCSLDQESHSWRLLKRNSSS
jgi:hypothetical protein